MTLCEQLQVVPEANAFLSSYLGQQIPLVNLCQFELSSVPLN